MSIEDANVSLDGIAIIGISVRFPGAPDVAQYWKNLKEGICSVARYSDEELLKAGVDPALLKNVHYVRAGSHLVDTDQFDAAFFGYTPREAECMDPQHRLFLECAWETFEHAGYNPETYKGLVGLFAGCGSSSYLAKNIIPNQHLAQTIGEFQLMIDNDNDYLTTRTSYKLNLRGPSINVQSACSTSLVAVCLGFQNLMTYQCDMALCGGVSLMVPPRQGYLYKDGFIFSPDGLCRAFDNEARGTIQGEGAGAVLLKRLDEALRDGDTIYAVIRGAAINNDGSLKAGFTAPSVDGQARVVAIAQELAGISPENITYIEAHGTGTPLGDPIEIAALTKAFRLKTERKSYCAIGSVKTNIGHLDAAAGIAGLVKAALSLKHRQIPPSLHFTRPNPELNIEESPFFVNTALSDWKTESPLRYAGVSSFGIGGTNAHVVLEEAPEIVRQDDPARWHVLPLSARTQKSLAAMTHNLAGHFNNNHDISIADASYTLQTGRKQFDYRAAVLCRGSAAASRSLELNDPRYFFTSHEIRQGQPVVFMFTGQGSQHIGMTAGIYRDEPLFKEELDACAEILKPLLGHDLRDILYPSEKDLSSAEAELTKTGIVQPALFAIEYSLAKFWMKKGICPDALIGHSIGEYVAACLSGVFPLEDAIRLVAVRAGLVQALPPGSMISVPLGSDELTKYLKGTRLSIAAINGPELCVVSGAREEVVQLEKTLHEKNISSRMLYTSHAFHSYMMEPASAGLEQEVKKISIKTPSIRYISNVTGTWITLQDVSDPAYWSRHLTRPVNFYNGIKTLVNDGCHVFLEVGPGNTLCSIVNRIFALSADAESMHQIHSLSHPLEKTQDGESLAKALAKLWLAGAAIDWDVYYGGERRRRVALPTYAFDRKRYWIEPPAHPYSTVKSAREIPKSGEETVADISCDLLKLTPQDDIELRLADIWSEILGIKELKIGDNFFDLGGDSLKATQLIAVINERLDQELTLTDLFIDPTIAGIIRLVKRNPVQTAMSMGKNEDLRFPVLFPIQPKGSNPPMFIVAGAHENRYFDQVKMKSSYEEDFLRYLSQLIPHIGMDQPLYAFRPKGLHASETPHKSVEEMATAYIKEIRTLQPEGPYLIAGECVGGIVAYEMAQQLHAAGQEVAHLIMMDTHCPSLYFAARERFLYIRRKIFRTIRNMTGDLKNGGLRPFIRLVSRYMQSLPPILFPVTKRQRSLHQIMLRSFEYQNTLLRYRPKPFSGKVSLIINEQWHRKEPDMGWTKEMRSSINFIVVPGDHQTRLTIFGGVTGKNLRDIIKKSWGKSE